MKFTATALAFLGATSLVTAAPVNITSTANDNTLTWPSNLPGCGFWVGNWCHMEMQLYRGPDAMASYTQCCHNHNCEPDLAGFHMEMSRRIIEIACGDMGVILMMVLMLDLTWVRPSPSRLDVKASDFRYS